MAIIPPSTIVNCRNDHARLRLARRGRHLDEAREALLSAWAKHRGEVLGKFPQLEDKLPEAGKMPSHFKITYREYERGGGYRQNERLV
jgi:hypothetical protein